uniref:ATP synthase complex subunit 8 n=1 Tax=Boreus elegans TaxID=948611 RepID=E9NQ62_BOREL|nr:ATP synthase F0 subunit 8 [Boreus elegans]
MPQMAPINWLSLFLLFSIIFLIYNYMNYYMYMPMYSLKSMNKSFLFKSLNWKW